MLLSAIPCSHCGGAGLQLEPDGVAVCKFCGTPNKMSGVICPNCEWVNPVGQETCAQCGTGLFRSCPECQTRNWSGATACIKCGHTLDTLAFMTARLQQADTTARLSLQQRMSREIKTEEERAAAKRSAQFQEMEERRRRGLAEASTRKAAEERLMWTVIFIGLFLCAALVGAVVLYSLLPK